MTLNIQLSQGSAEVPQCVHPHFFERKLGSPVRWLEPLRTYPGPSSTEAYAADNHLSVEAPAVQLCRQSIHGTLADVFSGCSLPVDQMAQLAMQQTCAHSSASTASACAEKQDTDCSTDDAAPAEPTPLIVCCRRWNRHKGLQQLPGPPPGLDPPHELHQSHFGSITTQQALARPEHAIDMSRVPWGQQLRLPHLQKLNGQLTVFWCVRRGEPTHAPDQRNWGWEPAWHDAASAPEQARETPVCLWVYTFNDASRGWSCNHDETHSEPVWTPMHGPWCTVHSQSSSENPWCNHAPATTCSRMTQHPGGYNSNQKGLLIPARCGVMYASKRHDGLHWPCAKEVAKSMKMWRLMTRQVQTRGGEEEAICKWSSMTLSAQAASVC